MGKRVLMFRIQELKAPDRTENRQTNLLTSRPEKKLELAQETFCRMLVPGKYLPRLPETLSLLELN